jgi:hypothetical protein
MQDIRIAVVLLAFASAQSDIAAGTPERIEFNRDVRPILSEHCFACHGPDKNKREADLRLDTREGLFDERDGGPVVVAGKPAEGKLLARVTHPDVAERMPPEEAGTPLLPAEIAILRRWVEQGAPWEGHWAFQPIQRPRPPVERPDAFVRGAIDAFILQELEAHSLKPSPQADRRTLVRRMHFDLVGLPPEPEIVEEFVADADPLAYEKLVDRLLTSPQFGERMAQWWLDLVRYADSVGYHGDQPVSVFAYREYVIRSFNANKPFDRFTLEQLAGDLLPGATPGDTIEHKIASGYNRLGMMSAEGGVQDKEYRAKYIAERVRNASGTWLGMTMGCCECHDHKFDPLTAQDHYRFQAFFADIEERGFYGGAESSGKWGPTLQLPTPDQAREVSELDQKIAAAREKLNAPTPELAAAQAEWESTRNPAPPDKIRKILEVVVDQRTDAQKGEVAAHYRSIAPLLESDRKELKEWESARAKLDKEIASTLITVSTTPRPIRVLKRGNWMDDSGPLVAPGIPEVFGRPASDSTRLTRLDLARWITSPENPLTARVLVNRLWKNFFWAGLSRKLDDVGAQGEWPSHPLLLDWLAGQTIDSGWDLKRTIRLIVLSSAYRQSSAAPLALREADPYHRWLGRQGRYRLDAEQVRDAALAVSGLLVERLGGRSVKPYQPRGYWAHLNFPQREWENGKGEQLYRRGLYTHWQRQYLHPSMLAFDAPCREECTAERPRSNTPLQSLALLNDTTYVEAARVFATRILAGGGATDETRIDWAYRQALSRPAMPAEQRILSVLVEKHRQDYRADRQSAADLLAVGDAPLPADVDPIELAAWTSAARAILNLHEMVTRQ